MYNQVYKHRLTINFDKYTNRLIKKIELSFAYTLTLLYKDETLILVWCFILPELSFSSWIKNGTRKKCKKLQEWIHRLNEGVMRKSETVITSIPQVIFFYTGGANCFKLSKVKNLIHYDTIVMSTYFMLWAFV